MNPIKSGMLCVAKDAFGPYVYKVVRPHRDVGYWETVNISGNFIHSIQIVHRDTILKQFIKMQD